MNYLVSWYCVKDPTKRYAIIPHENFVTWSEGKVKHQQSLSTSIQNELAAELKKEKSRRGAAQFEELYKLITEQDLEEIALYSTASVVASESSVNRRRKRDDSDDRCSFRLKIRYSQNEPQNSTSVSPEREGVDTLNGTYDNDDKPLAVDFARARTSIMAAFSGSPSQSEPGKHYDRSAFAEGRPDFKQATEDGSDSKEAAECVRHAESPRSGNSITTSHSTSEETQAVTQELTGRTIVETAEDFVSTFCSNANAVLLENKTLRSGIMKLEVEMHAIRQEHIRSLQQLKRYDATVNEDDDDDEVVNKGYVSATQLTEIVVPALSIDDVNYFEASAAYFRTTIAQNTVLRRIFGELAAQLEIEKATRLQLEGEVNQWKAHYDALMRCLQQLTKKSREYIKG